jgi:hypothetical protein
VKPRGPDKTKRKRRTDTVKPGPGRPPGSDNALPLGAVGAIKSLRHRLPEGLPEEVVEVADRAMGTVIAVMDGKIYHDTMARLGAAKYVREEICGPIAQKIEHTGLEGLAERIREARMRVAARKP